MQSIVIKGQNNFASSTGKNIGGFDAQVSDYGTYALEEDTEKKLLEEMANDITLKISTVLLRKK